MRIRQVALASTDLESTVDLLSDVLGIEVSFRDPEVSLFGLENAVFPVGQTFLEVCSPVSDDATLKRWIEKRDGDAGYMLIVQCDGEDEHRSRVAAAKSNGGKIIWEGGHGDSCAVHFHPRELGAIFSLDLMAGWDEWAWAGPKWREYIHSEVALEITGVEFESPDAERLAGLWAALLGLPLEVAEEGRTIITLPRGGRLVYTSSEKREGIAGIELKVANRQAFLDRAKKRGVLGLDGAVRIAGVRFIPIT